MQPREQHFPQSRSLAAFTRDQPKASVHHSRLRMARDGTAASVTCGLTCLSVLWLLGCAADGSALPQPDKRLSAPLRKEPEVNPHLQQINTSALNTALAFEPYHDLATTSAAEPGLQQQNILFSPLGLASALALLSRVSRSESRSQALEALGVAANWTEQSVEATMSALKQMQQSLTGQEGGVGPGVRRAESEAEVEAGAGIGAAAGANVDDGAEGGTGGEDQVQAGGRFKVWSGLYAEGKPSLDYESFLSRPQHSEPPASNISSQTLMKDLQGSDKLELKNYVYFKGLLPFERRHTVPRSFQMSPTSSVEVPMMFRDDSSDVMMLYDTNCTATVVRLAQSQRLALLLLLPKAELRPLEDCLSHSRMRFWLSNLKAGRAEILFPKFQLKKSYGLETLLRNSGVSSIFSDSADFSPISPKKTLKLVKAPHDVMLEVEETKSEDGGRPNIMLDYSVPPRITFNRPFMLVIYDTVTGLVLLMGRIIDPTNV